MFRSSVRIAVFDGQSAMKSTERGINADNSTFHSAVANLMITRLSRSLSSRPLLALLIVTSQRHANHLITLTPSRFLVSRTQFKTNATF